MKTNATEFAVLNSAIDTFGVPNQINMLFEESAELIDALCKYRRGRCTAENVVTEIADVLIMAEQMAIIFGEDAVEKEKKRKLNRLQVRIDYENKQR